MPDVTGKKLDVAYDEIKDAGFDDKDRIEIEGGGTFGVVKEGNWTVCEQSPATGETVEGEPKLTVERSCDDDTKDEPSGEPSNEPSDEPSDEPSEEPSEEPSPTEPALPKTLTANNNKDLAALLTGADCDDSISRFATKYAGQTIAFNGSIAAMGPHGDADTRYDILVLSGDKGENSTVGPSFQFADVNMFDLNLTGKVPDTFGVNDKAYFTAEVGDFNEDNCLFHLEPIKTEVR